MLTVQPFRVEGIRVCQADACYQCRRSIGLAEHRWIPLGHASKGSSLAAAFAAQASNTPCRSRRPRAGARHLHSRRRRHATRYSTRSRALGARHPVERIEASLDVAAADVMHRPARSRNRSESTNHPTPGRCLGCPHRRGGHGHDVDREVQPSTTTLIRSSKNHDSVSPTRLLVRAAHSPEQSFPDVTDDASDRLPSWAQRDRRVRDSLPVTKCPPRACIPAGEPAPLRG